MDAHTQDVAQLQDEITNTINRCTEESDLTLADVVGILEILKYNYITQSETEPK